MKTRLKIALSAALILFSLATLSEFFQWMNQPSDAWLYAGIFGALSLLVVVPALLGAIWGNGFFTGKHS
jgi:hypothetical protein